MRRRSHKCGGSQKKVNGLVEQETPNKSIAPEPERITRSNDLNDGESHEYRFVSERYGPAPMVNKIVLVEKEMKMPSGSPKCVEEKMIHHIRRRGPTCVPYTKERDGLLLHILL